MENVDDGKKVRELQLPCPFCGSHRLWLDINPHSPYSDDCGFHGKITCRDCGFVFHLHTNKNRANARKYIVGRWNNRVSPEKIVRKIYDDGPPSTV